MSRISEEEFLNELPATSPSDWSTTIYQRIFDYEEFPPNVKTDLSNRKKLMIKKKFVRKH